MRDNKLGKRKQISKPIPLPPIKMLVAKSNCFMSEHNTILKWGIQFKYLTENQKGKLGYANFIFLCNDCIKHMSEVVERTEKIENHKEEQIALHEENK
jgi:hypothetical protein